MQILVLFSSVEGQTHKIANHVADRLKGDGHVTFLWNSDNVSAPFDMEELDAVIALSSVHAGSLGHAFMKVIKDNHTGLMSRPGFLGIVSLTAETALPNEMAELDEMAEAFSEQTGWWPIVTHHIAGAMKYTEYDFFKKWIMKRIAAAHGRETDTSKDTEYTDWDAVNQAVDQFVHDVPVLRKKI